MLSSLRIIVTGLIAQHPLGGVTWDYLQYVTGLARLGHDVFYFEDSGEWPYDSRNEPEADDFVVSDCSQNINHLTWVMSRFGLADRWAYRCPIDGSWSGFSHAKRAEIITSADLLINVSGTLYRPEEYRKVPRMIYVDSDPVFTQIKLARGRGHFPKRVALHDKHFSFGESLSDAIPPTDFHWLPTRQPIVLSDWRSSAPSRDVFTTIMNWASYYPIVFEGRKYGQKGEEFLRFVDLPSTVPAAGLEIGIRTAGPKRRRIPRDLAARLNRKGWRIVDPAVVCPDFDSYRDYVTSSKAEWSIAKNGYVKGQCGWFSCRSACYLAAGRPVVVQDTGFSSVLPVGEGILSFNTVEEATAAIREVESNYKRHARAAYEIAVDYFDSNKVLSSLVDRAMNRTLNPASIANSGA